jgi:hypothetical protein
VAPFDEELITNLTVFDKEHIDLARYGVTLEDWSTLVAYRHALRHAHLSPADRHHMLVMQQRLVDNGPALSANHYLFSEPTPSVGLNTGVWMPHPTGDGKCVQLTKDNISLLFPINWSSEIAYEIIHYTSRTAEHFSELLWEREQRDEVLDKRLHAAGMTGQGLVNLILSGELFEEVIRPYPSEGGERGEAKRVRFQLADINECAAICVWVKKNVAENDIQSHPETEYWFMADPACLQFFVKIETHMN